MKIVEIEGLGQGSCAFLGVQGRFGGIAQPKKPQPEAQSLWIRTGVSSFDVELCTSNPPPVNFSLVTTNIEIRPARVSDALKLATLRFGLRSKPTNVESERDFVTRCTAWMTHALQQNNWRCWVAEQDETLLAALWLQLVDKIPNPTAEPECLGYITNFFVAESERGKGLGSRMLGDVLKWCREQQSQKVGLINSMVLWPTDRSRTLYLRHGFEVPNDMLELVLWR